VAELVAVVAVWMDGERVEFTPAESAEGVRRLGDAIARWLAELEVSDDDA